MLSVSDEVKAFAAEIGTTDPIAPVGGRTQWTVGGDADPASREVRAPSGISQFEPAEMTVTCGAGTTVADLQDALDTAGQRVALPDSAGATVGGVLAVGHSGTRRLGDGHIRDTLLQAVFVDAQGRVVRNGGPTVKNVSGFDLCKLLVGSLGTLGVLAEVTLRCVPVAVTSQWFTSDAPPLGIHAQLFRPVSILWDGTASWVLLEGNAADVAQQAEAAGLLPCDGPPATPRGGRESIRPSEIPSLEGDFLAEIGVGVVHRHGVVTPRPLEAGARALCQEVKRRFDPTGRLNPGRVVA